MSSLFTDLIQRLLPTKSEWCPWMAATAVALTVVAGSAQAGKLGVYTSDAKGFDTHTFYYDDGQEVVLIDTQFVPELTQAMVRQVQRETKSPITRVIVTHPNPDKFNGLSWLHQQGVTSVSSAGVADAMPAVGAYKKAFWTQTMKAFTPESYPAYADVQQRFTGPQTTLKLKSGETLTLFALRNSGVATQQVVVRIDATGDLVVGDLVHHKAHAWLEGGLVNGQATPCIDCWIAALDELPALSSGHPQAKLFGGRGEFVRVVEAVRAQQDYLRNSQQLVRNYVVGLGSRGLELNDPKTAQAHYVALEERLAAALPDYKLPYMVRYSVYGLAQAEYAQSLTSASRTARAPQVLVEHVFSHDADKTWSRLGRFCSIAEWQSLVAGCVVDERRDGLYRTVVMRNDTTYVERLERFSNQERKLGYSIVSGPLPVKSYVSELQVVPLDAKRSRLVWQAWYDAPSSSVEATTVKTDLTALFRNGIQGMERVLAAAQ